MKRAPTAPTEPTGVETLETMAQELKAQNPLPTTYTPRQRDERIPSNEELHKLKTSATAGVALVIAPQLFPTPAELAARMVELAEIEPEHRVLEPSAGTGNVLRAIGEGPDKTGVEINGACVQRLATLGLSGLHIHHTDFLSCTPADLGLFDCIVMNPPFENGADIKHITHALQFLKPGGRLVAICANGPRQHDKLLPIVERSGGSWEELPADTFKAQKTAVRTVLLSFTTEDDDPETRLREYWDGQGVSKERQDAILADVVSKAQPGNSVISDHTARGVQQAVVVRMEGLACEDRYQNTRRRRKDILDKGILVLP